MSGIRCKRLGKAIVIGARAFAECFIFRSKNTVFSVRHACRPLYRCGLAQNGKGKYDLIEHLSYAKLFAAVYAVFFEYLFTVAYALPNNRLRSFRVVRIVWGDDRFLMSGNAFLD